MRIFGWTLVRVEEKEAAEELFFAVAKLLNVGATTTELSPLARTVLSSQGRKYA